jgi:hypothetical protein
VQIGALGTFRLFDVGGLVAVIGLVIAFAAASVRNTRVLYQAEPLPGRAQAGAVDASIVARAS